jgi:hypothetical protein
VRAERYGAQLSVVVRGQFEAQRQEIVRNLSSWKFNKAYSRKDAKQDKKDKLAALIIWFAANVSLSDAMRPILYQLEVETGMDAVAQAGADSSQFDPLNPKIISAARAQADKAATAINQETEKQLRAELGQGIDADESIDELLARVEKVMGSALTMRTARIADTESYRAMGNADMLAWMQLGTVTGKEWYTAKDERVCPWCNAMDGTIIALDIPFFKEGDSFEAASRILNIAYDNVDAPPLHVSCRCVALDVTLA